MEDSNLQTKNDSTSIIRYTWDLDWADQIVHNVPIAKVAEELSQLKEVFGEVTPQILVNSSKNKKSVFHHYFEWDDEKAANAFRLQRAKQILSHIQVKTIKEGKPVLLTPVEIKTVPSYSIPDKQKDIPSAEGYDLMLKRHVINDLRILINRLKRVNAPIKVINLINTTIEEISKESTETKKDPTSNLIEG